MICLIEGTDGSGKSTLAREVAALTNAEVRHHSQPKTRHPLEEYLAPVQVLDRVVIDRLHLSEWVYGPIFRGESRLDANMMRYVDLYLESRGAVLVHLTGDPEVLAARAAARGEAFVRPEQFDLLVTSYHLAVRGSQVRSVLENPTADEVVRQAKRRELSHRDLRHFPDYVGPRFPEILLVGDQPNDRRSAAVTHVAFAPFPGSCGAYLWETLDDPRFYAVGVVNSVWGKLGFLWSVLGRPAVVALGAAADRRLTEADIPHGRAPHPQYSRRFQTDFMDEYRDVVAAAAFRGARCTSQPVRPRSERTAT